MKRDQLYFLIAGLVFGALVGAAATNYAFNRVTPERLTAAAAAGTVAQPQGPSAPTQVGGAPAPGAGGAPMVATINRLKERLQTDPRDLEALVGLANLYHDASMWEQAIGYYERAIEVRPEEPDLLTDMGICRRNMGDPAAALELFDRAQAASPGHWQSLFNTVVVAAFDLEQYERADEALTVMEGLTPRPPRVDELRKAVEERRAGAS